MTWRSWRFGHPGGFSVDDKWFLGGVVVTMALAARAMTV